MSAIRPPTLITSTTTPAAAAALPTEYLYVCLHCRNQEIISVETATMAAAESVVPLSADSQPLLLLICSRCNSHIMEKRRSPKKSTFVKAI